MTKIHDKTKPDLYMYGRRVWVTLDAPIKLTHPTAKYAYCPVRYFGKLSTIKEEQGNSPAFRCLRYCRFCTTGY